MCRHCSLEKDDKAIYYIACFKEKTMHGLPDSNLKYKDMLIR